MSGSTYIPDPSDPTQPTGTQLARTAAAEFRALKGFVNSLVQNAPTWNPNDKSDYIGLYNGDLLALKTAPRMITRPDGTVVTILNWKGARATAGKSGSQSYYIEHLVGTASSTLQLGISLLQTPMDNGDSLSVEFGSNNDSIGYWSDGTIWNGGSFFTAVAPYGSGDTIGIEFNATGSVSFYKNGVGMGTSNWNPTVRTYSKYPVVALFSEGDYVLTNFGASQFQYPIPADALPFYDAANNGMTGPQNILINADMYIDQRNHYAFLAAPATGTFVADRWAYYTSMAGAFSSQTVPIGVPNVQLTKGSRANTRLTVAATGIPGAGDSVYISQRVEGLKASRLQYGGSTGRLATLQFFYKSNVVNTFTVAIQNALRNRSFIAAFATIPATLNTWQRFSAIIPACLDGVWNTDNTFALEVMISLGAGANFKGTADGKWQNADDRQATIGTDFVSQPSGSTLDVTGFQLRPGYYGPTADNEAIDLSHQALECERYFVLQEIYNAGYTDAIVLNAAMVELPVPMRDVPTGNTFADANVNCGANSFIAISNRLVSIRAIGNAPGGFIQAATVNISAEI